MKKTNKDLFKLIYENPRSSIYIECLVPGCQREAVYLYCPTPVYLHEVCVECRQKLERGELNTDVFRIVLPYTLPEKL